MTRQKVTDYQVGLVHGLITGFGMGVPALGTILFLVKYWLP